MFAGLMFLYLTINSPPPNDAAKAPPAEDVRREAEYEPRKRCR